MVSSPFNGLIEVNQKNRSTPAHAREDLAALTCAVSGKRTRSYRILRKVPGPSAPLYASSLSRSCRGGSRKSPRLFEDTMRLHRGDVQLANTDL